MGYRRLAVQLLTAGAMSLTLVLSGCSSTSDDREATENVAKIGDNPPLVNLECTEKQVALKVPDGTTAISIEAEGAAGSQKSSNAENKSGGYGGSVVATYSYQLSDGNTLYAKVGCQGKDDGGYPDGGDGIKGANGGGGGSTGLYRENSGGDATDPIVVASGGGGSSEDGTPGGMGNEDSTAAGGAGVGNGKQCGGGGATADKAGVAKSYNGDWGNPWPGKDGKVGHGAAAPDGDTPGGMGGAGGGGHFGGASGCSAAVWCDDCFGSGGAGSSYADESINSPTFSPLESSAAGSLGLTFLCPESSGATKPCAQQPTPSQ